MSSEPQSPTVSPAPSAVPLHRLSWASPLAVDYCASFDRLGSFFMGSPADESAWRQVLEHRQRPSDTAAAVADVVVAQLERRAAPMAAREMAARLGRPGTVAIVTGQQAGLFGGPLFTVLKAITALRLARHVATQYGVTAVPVFWVDAEDHDLDEIRTCQLLDRHLAPHGVSLDVSGNPPRPAASVALPGDIAEVVGSLRDLLPETEFTEPLLARLQDCYRAGATFVDAFCRWFDSLMGQHGLVVFDSADRDAKPFARAVLEREIEAPGETARLAAAAGDDLVRHGYHAQVTPLEGSVALFRIDGARRAITLDGDAFVIGDVHVSSTDLLDAVRTAPEQFSPNVLLRPIVQDTLFPTVAYVAGPSELAYLAQLQRIYARFDVPMPIMYPRATATIVERATIKLLTKYALDFERLQVQDDSVLNRLLAAQIPDDVEGAITAAEQAIGDRLEEIAARVPTVDPTLAGAAATTRQRMERDLQTLRRKVVQAAKRRDETLTRQFTRARAQAFPNGQPQERAVGSLYFLARHGPELIEHLLADLPDTLGQHWLVTI